MTAPKKPAKKAAAKKAPARKRPARARREVQPGKHGPAPYVVRGFTWTPPDGDTPGEATWSPRSPAGAVLAALAIGATWEHAAAYARLHADTAPGWNNRGTTLLGSHASLDHFAATAPTVEDLAMAAFAVAATEARGAPVVGALESIDRARKAGDLRGAVLQLKHLPQAAPYRETTRHEVTGRDGGPLEVTTEERAERLAADAALFLAGKQTQGPAQGEQAPGPADPAGDS